MTTCWVVLLVLIGIHSISATALYGLLTGERGNYIIVEISNTTGEFTFIAQDKPEDAGFFADISCFDQARHTFYYTTDKALNAVDVLHKKELPQAKYGKDGCGYVSALIFDNITSQVIVAKRLAEPLAPFLLLAYPATTESGSHDPKYLANLTAAGIYFTAFETFDPVHRIFYSVNLSNYSSNAVLQLTSLSLDNPSNVTVVNFCLNEIQYMTYDPIQNKLVGIGAHYTNTTSNIQYYHAFVIEDDGSCSLSINLHGIDDVTATTYDPFTATFYIGYVGDIVGVYIFETKTSQITTVPVDDILYGIEVAY